MRMGQGVRTGLGHGGITCVLQTQFSSFTYSWTERFGKLITVSLILDEFSCIKEQIICCFAASHYIRSIFLHSVFFHKSSSKE